MSEMKMEKSDVGEMLGIVLLAKESEFGKVQIDTLDAEEVVTLAYESFDLKEENQKLREALVGLLECKGILTSDKDCVIKAKKLLEQTK